MLHLAACLDALEGIVPQAQDERQMLENRWQVVAEDLRITFSSGIVSPQAATTVRWVTFEVIEWAASTGLRCPALRSAAGKEPTLTKLLIATNNPGKVREYEALLEVFSNHLEVTFPAQESLWLEVEESGETFEENARIKAQAYVQASGLLTLADDSGLEVDALAGAPGVRSARYAGPDANDVDRYERLLADLAEVPASRRGARFRCVAVMVQPDGQEHIGTGICEGQIGFEPRGEQGFGYDPVFVVNGYGGQTMAELEPRVKNRISHRARALEELRPSLGRILLAPAET